jgi:hypothetical protein
MKVRANISFRINKGNSPGGHFCGFVKHKKRILVMPQFRSRDGRSTAILAVRMGKMPMLRSPKLRSCEIIEKGDPAHTIIQ